MTTTDLAYKYWAIFNLLRKMEKFDAVGVLGIERCIKTVAESVSALGLDETAERLFDRAYHASLEAIYGLDEETTPIEYLKTKLKVRQKAGVDAKFVDLLQTTKQTNTEMSSSYAIQSWLRNRGIVEFLTLRETSKNPEFDRPKADRLRAEVRETNSTLTLKRWITRTGAAGIVCLQGRYGGAYAHSVIARDYHMRLSPTYRLNYLSVVE